MPNGEGKAGYAVADRLREKTDRHRGEYNDAMRELVPDFSETTSPQILVAQVHAARDKSGPDSLSRLPVVSALPRRWRPYVVGAVLFAILSGTLSLTDGVRLLFGITPAPQPVQVAPEHTHD